MTREGNVAQFAGKLRKGDIDRTKTCPFLLRVFHKTGAHFTASDYHTHGKEPDSEIQIYTWRDATMREITDLIKIVLPEARRKDARLEYSFVFPGPDGHNVLREAGYALSVTHTEGDDRTLDQLGFAIGDFLDVAIVNEREREPALQRQRRGSGAFGSQRRGGAVSASPRDRPYPAPQRSRL
eukprot:m51a1_g5914 putative histone deacetylase complex subunit sap18-like (182) ;mRNA; f:34737-35669